MVTVAPHTRTCSRCKRPEGEVEFYERARGGRRGRCKRCMCKEQRVHREVFASAHPKRVMLNNAATRARKAGVPFELTESDFEIPAVCPVLGIPLEPGKGRRGPRDHSPTLDRVIPTRGYVRDNVVVVSWRANRLKSDGTMTELETIVRFYRAAESASNAS